MQYVRCRPPIRGVGLQPSSRDATNHFGRRSKPRDGRAPANAWWVRTNRRAHLRARRVAHGRSRDVTPRQPWVSAWSRPPRERCGRRRAATGRPLHGRSRCRRRSQRATTLPGTSPRQRLRPPPTRPPVPDHLPRRPTRRSRRLEHRRCQPIDRFTKGRPRPLDTPRGSFAGRASHEGETAVRCRRSAGVSPADECGSWRR